MAVEETVGVGGDSTEAVRELEKLKDKAVQVSRSLGGMAREAALTGLAVVGLDNVVAVLQRTVEFASESMSAFMARNRDASQSARVAATAMDTLKTQIGAAALGGGNAQVIFGALTEIVNQMALAVNKNNGAIQELTREGLADLIEGLANFSLVAFDAFTQLERLYDGLDKVDTVVRATVLRPFTELMEATGLAADGTAISLDEVGGRLAEIDARAESATERNAGLRSTLEEMARAARQVSLDMREKRRAIDGTIESVNEAIERYGVLNALFGSADAPEPPAPPPRPSAPPPPQEEYEVEDLMRVLRTSWQELTEASVQAHKERGTAVQQARDEVALELSQKQQEAAEAEQAQAQANAEKLTQIELDALAARQAIAQDVAASSADLLQGLMSGQEKAGKVIKQFLGQELQARGRAFLIEGAATIAVPGLQAKGAALLAGGAAMMAGGALLGGGGGGGGGGTAVASGAAPIPSSQSAGPSTAVTNQVSFGIVGDPRAAAALVADSTRNALREGYAVGAA